MQPQDNSPLFWKVQGASESETLYFLRGETIDIPITKWQYEQLAARTSRPSGNLSEADLVRLHGRHNPASPFYQGSESAPSGGTGQTASGEEAPSHYYELTDDNVRAAEEHVKAGPSGTTTFSTEEVTRGAQ
jgi:hypothetical protein